MNFNDLMSKMRELDAPVQEAAIEECGEPMSMPSPAIKPDTPPPSMSVNLNAQGLDDISELMKLMTKVNPDMINQPAPMSMPSDGPDIISIKPPMSGIGDLGNLDSGPLKMLPDLDKDEPHMEPDADNMGGPSDKDADNMPPMGDLDSDNDMKKKDREESFGNSVDDSEPEYGGMDSMIRSGNDMHKPKQSFSGKAYRGDNPMAAGAYESKEQLRASIREELLQRLAEAKGAK
jgi:hypothetical protein